MSGYKNLYVKFLKLSQEHGSPDLVRSPQGLSSQGRETLEV